MSGFLNVPIDRAPSWLITVPKLSPPIPISGSYSESSAGESMRRPVGLLPKPYSRIICGMSASSGGINPTKNASRLSLLPNSRDVDHSRVSISGAVFNVSTSIIGAGIMSIPATLKVLGVFPALTMIALIAWLADVSVEFLMRFTCSSDAITYSGVMRESFGKLGSFAVQVSVMVTNLGCLIVFLIIIGDVLCGNHSEASVHLGILQECFGIHWWSRREFALLLIIIILVPLVLFRRLESLSFTSAISVLLAVIFVLVSSILAISALLHGETKRPKLLPELDSKASIFNLFTAVPVIVTAFTFHFNVHPIGFELKEPSHMITATRISMALCATIYFAIGLFGYLLFGDSTATDILVNFDKGSHTAISSWLNDVVRLSYALHLILVFPLLNFSLRANIDELLFPHKTPLKRDTKRFLTLSIGLLAFSYVAAITIPNIWYFFQFVGSTAAVSLAFIFPGAIVLRDINGVANSRDRFIASTMIGLAVVTSGIAITSNVYGITQN